jgi:hypothetical protein
MTHRTFNELRKDRPQPFSRTTVWDPKAFEKKTGVPTFFQKY